MADEGQADAPTHAELFLRAIEIVDEIEDNLALLADTFRPKNGIDDSELSDSAARVRGSLPYILFYLLRKLNRIKDGLREAHESMSDFSAPDP